MKITLSTTYSVFYTLSYTIGINKKKKKKSLFFEIPLVFSQNKNSFFIPSNQHNFPSVPR
ncbi:MAG TPA: hypothetical protein DHV33_02305 [Candidatus Moranbacteria bacterium]|nr:hypothetical protein [Candidatus Moranbacteria bacterium]